MGFAFPEVVASMCTKCGRCRTVCPALTHPRQESCAPEFWAARLKDEAGLFEVSSGGVFWALASTVIGAGGVVYGAVRQGRDIVRHMRADTLSGAEKMRRSKYLLSDMAGIYSSVRRDLSSGREVLFTGTGCQVAALKNFIGDSDEGLFTAEVVCHGVPSALAWRSYISEHETLAGKNVVDVVCRDKSRGWRNNHYRIVYDDGSSTVEPSGSNKFHFAYLHGLTLRKACESCMYAGIPRIADITLADYWKHEGGGTIPPDDRGISLVAVNNGKGRGLIEKCAHLLLRERVSENAAYASCRHMCNPPAANPFRDDFLQALSKHGFDVAFKRFGIPIGAKRRRCRLVRWLAALFGRREGK